jgi:hypothetical protein
MRFILFAGIVLLTMYGLVYTADVQAAPSQDEQVHVIPTQPGPTRVVPDIAPAVRIDAPHVAPDRPVAGQVAVDRLLAARTTHRPLPVRGVPPRRILSGYLPPPTSPLSYSDPRLPLPPTPNGIAPNATLPRPFEALPYYYQAPAYNSGPDVRYLQSYDAYGPYIPPPLDIPSNPLPTY